MSSRGCASVKTRLILRHTKNASMAVLRFWGDHTVQENNIVQTIASVAGTLSAVIFVLPGLVKFESIR